MRGRGALAIARAIGVDRAVNVVDLSDGLSGVARQLGWPVRDTKVVRSQRNERMVWMTLRDKRRVAPTVTLSA